MSDETTGEAYWKARAIDAKAMADEALKAHAEMVRKCQESEKYIKTLEGSRDAWRADAMESAARVKELERGLIETLESQSITFTYEPIQPPSGHINVPLPRDCVQAWADCEDHHRPSMTVLFDACREVLEADDE